MRLFGSSALAIALALTGAATVHAQYAPVWNSTTWRSTPAPPDAGPQYRLAQAPSVRPASVSQPATNFGQQAVAGSNYDYAKFAEGQTPTQEPLPDPAANGNALPSDIDAGASPYESALTAPCGNCLPCNTCCSGGWYGALGGLLLTRANANPVWTSALVSNNNDQVLNSVDANGGWRAGGLVRVGRRFCCGGALEASWWSIAPITGYASVTSPGNLLTPIDLFGVNIGGVPATNYFDNADTQAIWRRDTFQNIEVNWYSAPMIGPGQRCAVSWLAGVRYFVFNEGLIFGSVTNGSQWGQNGGLDEAYMNAQVRNRLVGPQVGVIGNFFIGPRLSLFAAPKFGIFNDFMSQQFQVYRGDGLSAMNVQSSQNNIAFVSQFETGLNYAITPNFSVFGGYMVLIASGVALADNQYPHFLVDQPEIAHIKPNGDLILHGAMFGVQFLF